MLVARHVARCFVAFNKLTTHSTETVGELKRPEACEHFCSAWIFAEFRDYVQFGLSNVRLLENQ